MGAEDLALARCAVMRYPFRWEKVRDCQRAAHFGSPKILRQHVYYPVHPGIAKQVMEPASVGFERRILTMKLEYQRQP